MPTARTPRRRTRTRGAIAPGIFALATTALFSVLAAGCSDGPPKVQAPLAEMGTKASPFVVASAPSAATPAPFTITIDATALTQTTLAAVQFIDTRTVQNVPVSPGVYVLNVYYGQNSDVAFTVNSDGTIAYDPSLEGVLSGAGTRALVVHGRRIQVDARALSQTGLSPLVYTATDLTFPANATGGLVLLPAHGYRFYVGPYGRVSDLTFDVDLAGHVHFAPTYAACASGDGTSTLTLKGFRVNVTAALSLPTFLIDATLGATGIWLPTGQPNAVTLLPLFPANGLYQIVLGAGEESTATYNIDESGHFVYSATFDGYLSGRGTSSLAITPQPIFLDATDRGPGTFFVTTLPGVPAQDRSAVHAFNLIPMGNGYTYNDSTLTFPFTVGEDGTLDYASTLDAQVSGRGTNTLKVRGSYSLAYPAFNEVFQKAIHNAYWTKNVGADADGSDIGAAGVHMRTWDLLMHEHARSLEWDLHRDEDHPNVVGPGAAKHPGEYRIYHTDIPDNSTCFSLADCLQFLQRLDVVLPQHEVVHIALELKQVDRLLFDDGLFDDSDFKPEEIDRVLWEHLGSRIFTPAEFMSRCPGSTNLRDCAARVGWPTTDQLRGRYIFTIHGTETPGAPGAANERAWWEYTSADIRTRAAFPMYVVSDGVVDRRRQTERALHYNSVTTGFMAMWRQILDNTIIFDLEDPANNDFVETDGGVTLPAGFHGIVRPAAAHYVDLPLLAGGLEDNQGVLLQKSVVAAGWQWLMTDYPANFISDIQFDDPNPLKLPSRVSRPFFKKTDVVAARAGAAARQAPTFGEPELVEPGNRVYFDTANRIMQYDLRNVEDLPAAKVTVVAGHHGSAQALMTAPTFALEAAQDWELFPGTSMQGHDDGPAETTPYGPGCFVASATSSGAHAGGTWIRVCRKPSNDDARDVDVSVETQVSGAAVVSASVRLPFHIVQGANVGDALRVRLERSGASTIARVFTAAEVNPDGSMAWIPWSPASFTIAADLRYQGLQQINDGVFAGTRVNGKPLAFSQLTATDTYVSDLSFCADGSCRGPQLPSHETISTGADGASYVGVHETEGAVYGGQWRTLYTTDVYEVATGGLMQYPRPNKFVLRRTAGDATWAPLYKCIDWTRDVHTYWLDTDAGCPNDKGPRGRSAGAMGLLSTIARPNAVPLFHTRKGTKNATNVNTHDHYFALGNAELAVKIGAGYELVKQVGWVYPSAASATRQ